MQMDRYLDSLRSQLAAVASVSDETTQEIAERMSTSLDAAVRVTLLEMLSDAADDITRELAPGSVDVRLRGRDPELVVTRPADVEDAAPDAAPSTSATPAAATADDDAATSRTTLRLPDQLKARVEQAAAEEGVSLNSWLVRAIASALETSTQRTPQRRQRTGNSFTGWAR